MSSLIDPELTPAEMSAAATLLERTLTLRALPDYSPAERLVLAILAANLSRQQSIRGKKSKNSAKRQTENRRQHVNLLLRYVVPQRCRDKPNSLQTVMEIIDWLDRSCGIQATEPQVRRDIHAALKLGDLPKW
jgi:hypothetical protein